MYGNNLLKLHTVSGAKNSKQATIIESQAATTEAPVKKLNVATVPDGVMFLIPFSFVTVWIIITFTFSKIASRVSNEYFMFPDDLEGIKEEMLTIENFHKFPCRSCRYFANNPHLKCAVQPENALTLRSLNCSDYCPQDRSC